MKKWFNQNARTDQAMKCSNNWFNSPDCDLALDARHGPFIYALRQNGASFKKTLLKSSNSARKHLIPFFGQHNEDCKLLGPDTAAWPADWI